MDKQDTIVLKMLFEPSYAKVFDYINSQICYTAYPNNYIRCSTRREEFVLHQHRIFPARRRTNTQTQ